MKIVFFIICEIVALYMAITFGQYHANILNIAEDNIAFFLGYQMSIFYIFFIMSKYVNMYPINSPLQEVPLSVKSYFDIDIKAVLATLGLVMVTFFTLYVWLPYIYPHFIKPFLSFLY